MAGSSVLIQLNPEFFSAYNIDNYLWVLQVKIKFRLKFFNLQSRTLDLGHTTLVPVFLSSMLFCNGHWVELSKLEANIEGKEKRRSSITCQCFSFN